MGVGGQRHATAALPPGKTRYPLYWRLAGPPEGSGRVRKISPTPEFDPWTVQLVANRYTDWAMPVHFEVSMKDKNNDYVNLKRNTVQFGERVMLR